MIGKIKSTTLSVMLLLSMFGMNLFGQGTYRNHMELSAVLKQLNSQYPDITKLQSIATTSGNKDIWVLEVGRGDVDNHPGLAIVGGVDGRYISGPELTVRFAEKLLESSAQDSIKYLIDSMTFYIIPNVSPDATEQYFASIKYCRDKNARATDDDRDGRLNEDPFEDLDGNGLITSLRIRDPKGKWILHPEDERIMIKADKNKGEKGEYILISEGIDNDGDKAFNEDGEGGITFNKNMAYKFDHFKPGAGDFPVSEIETKAVLDYLYDRWNIFAVFTFGPSDNLSMPLEYVKGEAEHQITSSILESDAVLNAYISKRYNELTGEKSHTQMARFNGDFMQWAYFHYGRLSFSTPAFYIPEIKEKPDTTQVINKKNKAFNPEVNFLRWADSVIQEEYFQDWRALKHPDFPENRVEIGGYYPFVRNNPPVQILDSISDTHNQFILWLASERPTIEVHNIQTEHIGKDLFRIEFDIYNGGLLPALCEIGEKTRWVKKPKISIKLQNDQEVVSGHPVQLLDKLPGDSAHHASWLIKEKGTVIIEAGAPQTGIQVIELELK
jgi:hypothetical protein